MLVCLGAADVVASSVVKSRVGRSDGRDGLVRDGDGPLPSRLVDRLAALPAETTDRITAEQLAGQVSQPHGRRLGHASHQKRARSGKNLHQAGHRPRTRPVDSHPRDTGTRLDNQRQYGVDKLLDISDEVLGRISWYLQQATRTSWRWARRAVGVDSGKPSPTPSIHHVDDPDVAAFRRGARYGPNSHAKASATNSQPLTAGQLVGPRRANPSVGQAQRNRWKVHELP